MSRDMVIDTVLLSGVDGDVDAHLYFIGPERKMRSIIVSITEGSKLRKAMRDVPCGIGGLDHHRTVSIKFDYHGKNLITYQAWFRSTFGGSFGGIKDNVSYADITVEADESSIIAETLQKVISCAEELIYLKSGIERSKK